MALAAGWKALFLCSGIFVAGLTEEQVEATDLKGGYPDLQPHLAALPTTIDRAETRVLVPFGMGLPPRIAVRTLNGCTQMPIGMTLDALGQRPGPMPIGPSPFDPADVAALDARPWPLGDADATVTTPAAVGAAAAAALGGLHGPGSMTSAVLVVHRGRIVAEHYAQGIGIHTPQRTWSVAKSLTSALIGRAAALGLVAIDRSPHFEPRPDPDPRAAITIDQLLRMQSGLWTDGPGNRTDALYFGGATVRETAATAPLEAAPGTRFRYANNDTLLAALAIDDSLLLERQMAAAVAGLSAWRPLSPRGFASDELLAPAGMTRTTIERDWQGRPILSSQVWMTARDMARLALLHLNDGQVPDGQKNGNRGGMVRLLPEGWVRDSTSAQGPQPGGDMGYGRAIWLMGARQGLPEGTYAFLGNRGQIAIIVPSERLVVVRRGFDPHGVRFDGPALVRSIIAALGAETGG